MDTKIIMFPVSRARQPNPRDGDEHKSTILRPCFGKRGSSDKTDDETTPRHSVSIERGRRVMNKRMIDASIMVALVRPMFSTGFVTTLVS